MNNYVANKAALKVNFYYFEQVDSFKYPGVKINANNNTHIIK